MTTAPPIHQLTRPLRPWMAQCESMIAMFATGYAAEVTVPAIDTLGAGGKRVRPMMVFCSSSRSEDDRAALVVAAAAVELVHMATLVHDDLIDGAPTRRGRPTVARAHGTDAAINVGDFLFARAFAELARVGEPAAVAALADASLDLARGEMDQQRAAGDLNLNVEAYMARCRRKTGALFAASGRLGALMSGGSDEAQARLAAFGEHVGVAFQVLDDILDFAGSPDAMGKRRGTDILSGTVTLPQILAIAEDPAIGNEIGRVAAGGDGLEALCDQLAAHPGTAAARQAAINQVDLAVASLDGDIGGADADALRVIATGVVERFA